MTIASSVIATLPGCPPWCREHDRGSTDVGSVWHLVPLGSVEVDGEWLVDSTDIVSVRVEQAESIVGRDVIRRDVVVKLATGNMEWDLTAEQARAIGGLLTAAADHLDKISR